ncbi:Uma2 family endonuclease [Nostoc sp. CCCryo 231-06]|nr:Uma2 family endonuclease [Nostoc sp. CCCryo 231-06]
MWNEFSTVLSANSSRIYATPQKTSEYAAMGVVEYWIVDPLENKLTVCLLNQGSYKQFVFAGNQQIVSQIFPELTLAVQQILLA